MTVTLVFGERFLFSQSCIELMGMLFWMFRALCPTLGLTIFSTEKYNRLVQVTKYFDTVDFGMLNGQESIVFAFFQVLHLEDNC